MANNNNTKLTPDTKIILFGGTYDEEYGAQKWQDVKTISDIADSILEQYNGRNGYEEVKKDVDSMLQNGDYHGIVEYFMSLNDEFVHGWDTMENQQKEEQRKYQLALEKCAKQFEHVCGHKVGTEEYVLAALAELDSEQSKYTEHFSGEAQMERYMDARFCGNTEHFFDDEQYSSEHDFPNLTTMHDVVQYLEDNCALLMKACHEKYNKHSNK